MCEVKSQKDKDQSTWIPNKSSFYKKGNEGDSYVHFHIPPDVFVHENIISYQEINRNVA